MLRPPPDSFLQDLKAWQNSEAEHPSEQYYLRAQKHLTRISEAKRTLYSAYIPFNGDSSILPAQCRKAIVSLNEMSILAQEFSASLNPSLGLMPVFTAPSCDLLFTLRVVEEQSANLITLINSYRANCMNPSSQYALLQRKHISSAFKRLLSYVEDILLQAKRTGDETKSREPQLQLVPVEENPIEFTDFNSLQSWQDLLQIQGADIFSLFRVDTLEDRKGQFPRILYLEDYRNGNSKAAKQL